MDKFISVTLKTTPSVINKETDLMPREPAIGRYFHKKVLSFVRKKKKTMHENSNGGCPFPLQTGSLNYCRKSDY